MKVEEFHKLIKNTKLTAAEKISAIQEIIAEKPYLLHAVNAQRTTALMQAASVADLELITLLIDQGNVNAQNITDRTALMFAISANSSPNAVAVVEYLLRRGASVLLREKTNLMTPLLLACQQSSSSSSNEAIISIVKLLLAHGSDLSERDKKFATGLHYAAERGCLELIQLLVSSSTAATTSTDDTFTAADMLSATTITGYTPLMKAIYHNHATVALYLMFETKRNIPRPVISTAATTMPLILASQRGFEDIVIQLLDYYKDNVIALVSSVNDKNQTAFEVAEKYPSIQHILLQAGAAAATATTATKNYIFPTTLPAVIPPPPPCSRHLHSPRGTSLVSQLSNQSSSSSTYSNSSHNTSYNGYSSGMMSDIALPTTISTLTPTFSVADITLESTALFRSISSVVFRGTFRSQPIVVKQVYLPTTATTSPVAMTQEIRILTSYKHTNIVLFHGIVSDMDEGVGIIMEYLPLGSLFDALHKSKTAERWSLLYKLQILHGVASALSYLHACNIIHRDIKSANILLTPNSAKLSDFGLSIESLDSAVDNIVGTRRWASPEALRNEELRASSDVYSYGLVAVELFTGDLPIEGVIPAVPSFGCSNRNDEEYLKQVVTACFDTVFERPLCSLIADGIQMAIVTEEIVNKQKQAQRDIALQFYETRDANLASALQCLICYNLLVEPVMEPRGYSYCKPCIQQWLQEHDTSPMTRDALTMSELAPNRVVSELIEKYEKKE